MKTLDFNYYQNANSEGDDIAKDFIIRKNEFDTIMQNIRRYKTGDSIQHFLILGRRGSGKSTLLKRTEYEISTDAKLSKHHIVVNLPEEQSSIYRLFDLWDAVLAEFENLGLVSNIDGHIPESATDYARERFKLVQEVLTKQKKQLVLLLDNLDRIFENIGEDAHVLREQLINFSNIRIIGGSTRMSEHFWKYNQPFYEFFKVMRLEGCSRDEVHELLMYWSKRFELPEIEQFIKEKPGQLEAIRILTDGLPRTLQFFVSLLINRPEQNGYGYLKRIIDLYSPLYQERLNNLSPSQRVIITKLANFWEAATAKELEKVCTMPSKTISSQLIQLRDAGIVEVVATKTKNNLYRLTERFFNLWLIMTQGSPAQKRSAKCWTIFLENWYNADEIRALAKEHITKLAKKELNGDYASLMTKALAQSKFVPFEDRDKLILATLKLKDMPEEAKKHLPKRATEILASSLALSKERKYFEAITILNEIEQDFDLKTYAIMAALYGLNRFGEVLKLSKKISDRSSYLYTNVSFFIIDSYYQLEKYSAQVISEGSKILNSTHQIDNKVLEYTKQVIAHSYYRLNENKQLAMFLISNVKEPNPNILLFVKLWNGVKITYEEIKDVLNKGNDDSNTNLLIHLLCHFQYKFVLQIFSDAEFTIQGTGREPLYFLTLKLKGDDEQSILKIPPEFLETVDSLASKIKVEQRRYYPDLALK